MKRLIVPGVLMLLLGLAGCSSENESAQIIIDLKPLHNGSEITADQVLQTADGRNFSVEDMKVYFTDMYLVKDDGAKELITDLDLLEWPSNNFNDNKVEAVVEKADYAGLEFYVGLDPQTNDVLPTDFASEHPLSADQDMHWGMLKYRFLTIMGKVDTSDVGDQEPDNAIIYHLGRDQLYSKVEITQNLNITGTGVFLTLDFEVGDLFDGPNGTIDIKTKRVNHSPEQLMGDAQIVVDNFVDALEAD